MRVEVVGGERVRSPVFITSNVVVRLLLRGYPSKGLTMLRMLHFLLMATVPNEHAFDSEIRAAVRDARHVFEVPPELVKAVIKRESSFNPKALSRAGAVGLMQIMPYNAPHLGLSKEDLGVASKNIFAGTRLLAVLLHHYQGDVISALVAYNARPRKLFAPIPENGETPAYVRAVLRYWRAYSGEPLPGMRLSSSGGEVSLRWSSQSGQAARP